MDIIKIVSFAVITVVLVLLVRNTRPEMSILVEIAAGIAIFILISAKLFTVSEIIVNFARKVSFNTAFLEILLKVVAITYISEFGIGICKDASQSALASKVELCAKVLIIIVALPILSGLIDTILTIIR